MDRLRMIAELASTLRRAEAEADELQAHADALAGEAPDFPQEWADEEADMLDGLAKYFAQGLWGEHRDTVSLLARIRDVTSGRMVRPCIGTETDWRRYCPSQYRRMGNGMPADEVADMLGIGTDDDLLHAIITEAEDGAGYTHAAADADARAAAQRDPEYVALRAEHAAAYEGACLAWEADLARAEGYREAAAVQARMAATIRQALVVMMAAPVPQPARQQKVGFVAALPTRGARRAAEARSVGETVRAAAGHLAAEVRRIATETGEGAAIAAGWFAAPTAAWWTEVRREMRGQLAMGGRHAKARPAGDIERFVPLVPGMQEGRWAA